MTGRNQGRSAACPSWRGKRRGGAGNSQDGIEGFRNSGQDGRSAVAPRMVLAAGVTPKGGGEPPGGTG
jgi:hypothetical protein